MTTADNYGLPEVPEVPSVPIFPSREIDRYPYRLPRGGPHSAEEAESLPADRLELSAEGRAFHSARMLFEDIVASLGERMRESYPPLVLNRPDPARLDEALSSRREQPPLATAEWMRFELERIGREAFSRVETVRTEAFEAFRSAAREAVRDAARRTGERLDEVRQLDEPTRERIEEIATAVLDGIATITPR
jgi:hypothetical protein